MKQAVLLLAHGAPERLEDIPQYLHWVRGGRPTPEHLVEEVRQRYARIGGASPLLRQTRAQAEALAQALSLPVYYAMRNWHPLIADVMAEFQKDPPDRLIAVCLAPQYSKLSVGLYFRQVQDAKTRLGLTFPILWTKSFYDHPRLISAFASMLRPCLPSEKVLFTAHSLPERILETGDDYPKQARATADLVAAQLGLESWDFAYQSQGQAQAIPSEKWLGPTVESVLDRYAAEGVRSVAICPIGFVSDHVEILYDIDIQFRDYAEKLGIRLVRSPSLNDSPEFISALSAVVRERIAAADRE